MPAASVVGPFGPGDDFRPQLIPGGPLPSVGRVRLQQGEERLHGGLVAGGAGLAYLADHVVTVQGADECPAAKLRSSAGAQDASGGVTAAGHGVVEGLDGQVGLHPVADPVAHDPVGEHVLDRAEAELDFVGPVFGDACQPQLGGASVVKSRLTRSSWTGGPGFLLFLPRFVPTALHQPLVEQIRHIVRSHAQNPASLAWSARNR